MLLLDFVNEHSNWYELLTNYPYNLIINREDNYYLFKYNMIESDMSNPIVRESRGCILYDAGNHFELVCYPFDKFFNIDEPNNDIQIDWGSACVQEKVDGSLIKIWYHNEEWHISTNGTVSAKNAQVVGNQYSFFDLVCFALPEGFDFSVLNEDYTYMFELVSPLTQVVIQYDNTELYYLGRRNNKTELEDMEVPKWVDEFDFKYPNRYSLKTKEECKIAVDSLEFQGEGFVVCDNNFHRVKIKSPKYVLLHHSISNIHPTDKFFLECIRENNIDDVLSLKPIFKDYYADFMRRLSSLVEDMQNIKKSIPEGLDKKEYALYIKNNHLNYSGYLFSNCETPYNYLEKMPVLKVCKLLDNFR